MSGFRPAWSSQFDPDQLPPVFRDPLLDSFTPEQAWGGSTGKGVRVAVIDSGIENTHPDIAGAVTTFCQPDRDENGNITFSFEPHDDAFGHGTACAAIIRKLAPEVELVSVRVLGPRLSGAGVVFAAGLRWAIEQGVQVCNLSLGTTVNDFRAALHELADMAAFRNVLLVAAANNMPVPSFPSMYASVISVAATEDKDPENLLYNPVPPVDFGAPGINVDVAWLGGGHMTVMGNSFAAPQVAGLAARILGKHPGLTPWQVKTVLRAVSRNVREAAAARAERDDGEQKAAG
ncbi:MAG TPA: S8 family serine peptidase [Dehalococcoidia bacterium]|nr:S8 family serine peptidase [Dehalococcoidia bacterium]